MFQLLFTTDLGRGTLDTGQRAQGRRKLAKCLSYYKTRGRSHKQQLHNRILAHFTASSRASAQEALQNSEARPAPCPWHGHMTLLANQQHPVHPTGLCNWCSKRVHLLEKSHGHYSKLPASIKVIKTMEPFSGIWIFILSWWFKRTNLMNIIHGCKPSKHRTRKPDSQQHLNSQDSAEPPRGRTQQYLLNHSPALPHCLSIAFHHNLQLSATANASTLKVAGKTGKGGGVAFLVITVPQPNREGRGIIRMPALRPLWL